MRGMRLTAKNGAYTLSVKLMENTEQLLLTIGKMDRTAISVGELHDESDEKAYWLSKTPDERLAAMELMRQILYGYEYSTAPRLQRVFTVAERTSC